MRSILPGGTLAENSNIFSVVAMPYTPGTLNEYDMIIAVSQAAINAQFQILFTTDNPKDTKTPKDKLIPKTMKLGYKKFDTKTNKMKDSKQGITADIECPTVDLTTLGDGGTLYRSIRIIIKMKTGTLNYFDEGDLETLDVAGYTLSWVAQLGKKNIQDIEEEAMHPDAKKAVKKALDEVGHDDYLASSLFCLFESTQAANSFLFKDKNGDKVKDDSQVAAFLNSLIVTLGHTDVNPYVLGYGISQKVAKPKTGTPAFFPAKFYFSTTPNSNNNDQASLNFCIINGDVHQDKLINPEVNPSAGVLSPPLVDVTRSSKLKNDGIFVVSDALFFNHWLKPTIFDTFSFSGNLYDDIKLTVNTKITGGSGSANATKNQDWISDWIETGSIWTGKGRRQYSGTSAMTITYTSVLQSQTSGDISADSKRNVTVKVVGEVYNKLQFNSYGIAGWVDEGYLDATTKWDFTLLISAAKDGKWSVEKKVWNIPGTTTSANHINVLGYLDAMTNFFSVVKLAAFLSGLGGLSVSAFDGISKALKSISTSIIMPAGDVFTYVGLDSDDAGNLYSHITYTKA